MNLVLAILLVAFALNGQERPLNRPLVTVTGTAELKVVPDVVDISIGVEIRAKELDAALEQQTSRVAEASALIRKAGVDAKDIQTDYTSITPVYSESRNGRNLDYYRVTKSIAFTLKDIDKYDSLIASLIQSGVNRISRVSFRSTDIRKYRDQAREMAVVAAKEKAVSLAAKLDQKIGKAFTIDEDTPAPYSRPFGALAMAANTTLDAASDGAGPMDGSLMLGQISVQASVRVQFELQ
jgi:uncharacterized protein YggE